jgi:DNA polymerase-3 subunit gamma/tau
MDEEKIAAIAASMAPEDVQLFYQIGLIGRRDLPLAPDPRVGFEMVLLRMLAFKPASDGGSNNSNIPPVALKSSVASARAAIQNTAPKATAIESGVAKSSVAENTIIAGTDHESTAQQNTAPKAVSPPQANGHGPARAKAALQTESANNNSPDMRESSAQIVTKPRPASATMAKPISQESQQWHQLVERLNIAGITQQLALNCALKQQTAQQIHLELAESRRQLLNPSRHAALEQALQACLDPDLKLSIDVVESTEMTPAEIKSQRAAEKQQDAEQSIYNDQTVKTLINTFDAQVAPDSIAPID